MPGRVAWEGRRTEGGIKWVWTCNTCKARQKGLSWEKQEQIPLFSAVGLPVAGAPSLEVLVLWGKMLCNYPHIGEAAEPCGKRQ